MCVQGIEGHGFYGNCVVPIIENTARECELTDRLRQAIQDYPQANAVLVRRHGEEAWLAAALTGCLRAAVSIAQSVFVMCSLSKVGVHEEVVDPAAAGTCQCFSQLPRLLLQSTH